MLYLCFMLYAKLQKKVTCYVMLSSGICGMCKLTFVYAQNKLFSFQLRSVEMFEALCGHRTGHDLHHGLGHGLPHTPRFVHTPRKCVFPTGSYSCKLNSFSYERFCTRTRFETEAQGNSEMAYYLHWGVRGT